MFIKWSKFLVENNKLHDALFFLSAAQIKRESQLHPIVIMRDSHLDELEAFFFCTINSVRASDFPQHIRQAERWCWVSGRKEKKKPAHKYNVNNRGRAARAWVREKTEIEIFATFLGECWEKVSMPAAAPTTVKSALKCQNCASLRPMPWLHRHRIAVQLKCVTSWHSICTSCRASDVRWWFSLTLPIFILRVMRP